VTDSCINNVSLENETFSIGNKDNANIALNLNVIESIDHQKSVSNDVSLVIVVLIKVNNIIITYVHRRIIDMSYTLTNTKTVCIIFLKILIK